MSRITIKDLYLQYPNKWRNINSKTIELPYFPKEEITDNKLTLDYHSWKKIVLTYHRYLLEYLLTGRNYITPHNVGHFQIQKIKSKKNNIDWNKTKKIYGPQKGLENKKFIKHKNIHWGGYAPLVKWKTSPVNLKYKYHWKFKPIRAFMSTINNKLNGETSILNFKDAR